MTAPEVSAPHPKENGVMGPPQHPTSPPPEEASSPNRPGMWPNGVPTACKGVLEKPEVVVNGETEQARPAEGTAPLPVAPEGQEPPKIAPTPGDQPAASAPDPSAKPQNAVLGALTPAQQQAVKDLEGMLARVSALDTGGWFQYPVTEREAPNYHSIIKQPMCFQMMRSKIQNLQYVTWADLEADFNLICSNATTYNQKRSRVHKLALTMAKNGRRLMLELEPAGRAALATIYPDVAAAAAAGAAGPAAPRALSLTPTSALALATVDTGASEDDVAMEEAALGEAQSGAAALAGDDVGGYSSYDDDTDLEDTAFEPPPQQPSLAGEAAVADIAWGRSGADGMDVDAAPGSSAATAAKSGYGGAGGPEWKAAKRSTEWRMQWIRLRAAELAHQRRRYADAALAARRTQRASPSSEQPQQQQQQEQQQQQAMTAARPPRPPTTYPHRGERRPQPDLELPGILEHPFFAEHGMVAPSAAPEEAAAVGVDADDFPARAHAALSLLGSQLASLRAQLVAMQAPAPPAAIPHHALLRLPAGRGRGRGRGRAPGRTPGVSYPPRSYSFPARQASMYSLHGEDSLRLKRRRPRDDYDLNDMVTPGSLGAPKFVERPQVKAIETPHVRTLAPAEVKRRDAAVKALAAAANGGDAKAAAAAVLAACPDEGSSSEDDDDAVYEARHLKQEEEERARYEAFTAASLRKAAAAGKSAGKGSKGKADGNKSSGRAMKPARTASAPAQMLVGPAAAAVGATPAAPAPSNGKVVPNGTAAATPGPVLVMAPQLMAMAAATAAGKAGGVPAGAAALQLTANAALMAQMMAGAAAQGALAAAAQPLPAAPAAAVAGENGAPGDAEALHPLIQAIIPDKAPEPAVAAAPAANGQAPPPGKRPRGRPPKNPRPRV